MQSYVKPNHFAIHQKLTQYCKSTLIFAYLFITTDFLNFIYLFLAVLCVGFLSLR